MKLISLVVAGFLIISAIGYLGSVEINRHIDQESGAIVEETLSDNTIYQLQVLTEVQMLLTSGEVTQTSSKISKSVETLVYILQDHCDLPKCEEAIRNYERIQSDNE
ncbi:hypothetical protein [Oceanobacter kriegii]|uniref:hypothetical protein n=1 Tax=Oceanobacter kriegii TaxID=64972 RepID=UPI00048814F7|nr:hypothetical protein [Oceanobacter kriegii]